MRFIDGPGGEVDGEEDIEPLDEAEEDLREGV